MIWESQATSYILKMELPGSAEQEKLSAEFEKVPVILLMRNRYLISMNERIKILNSPIIFTDLYFRPITLFNSRNKQSGMELT